MSVIDNFIAQVYFPKSIQLRNRAVYFMSVDMILLDERSQQLIRLDYLIRFLQLRQHRTNHIFMNDAVQYQAIYDPI
ncbi:MAG: hypothetical protein P8Z36_02950, partial [Gemmatimonadota bacterium]